MFENQLIQSHNHFSPFSRLHVINTEYTHAAEHSVISTRPSVTRSSVFHHILTTSRCGVPVAFPYSSIPPIMQIPTHTVWHEDKDTGAQWIAPLKQCLAECHWLAPGPRTAHSIGLVWAYYPPVASDSL